MLWILLRKPQVTFLKEIKHVHSRATNGNLSQNLSSQTHRSSAPRSLVTFSEVWTITTGFERTWGTSICSGRRKERRKEGRKVKVCQQGGWHGGLLFLCPKPPQEENRAKPSTTTSRIAFWFSARMSRAEAPKTRARFIWRRRWGRKKQFLSKDLELIHQLIHSTNYEPFHKHVKDYLPCSHWGDW